MNKFIVLGIIITTIFVVKLESTRISQNERINEHERINFLKYKIIMEYFQHYDLTTALEILSQYIMNESEMYEFAENFNKSGNPPDWSINRQLKNPKFYETLRYERNLESLPAEYLEIYIHGIIVKLQIIFNIHNFPINALLERYLERNLEELISFEDYLAIAILLQDESQIYLENPAAWRMRRALYSLAIRQYSSNSELNFNFDICFSMHEAKRNFIDDIKIGDTFEMRYFSICSSKNKKSFSYSSVYNNDTMFYTVRCKTIITDFLLRVSLEDIVDNVEGIIYVIFPKVEFSIRRNPLIKKTEYGDTVFLITKTFPFDEKSNWITAMANEIENYKQKEIEYFNNQEN
ncbi:uncharacterized protein LOC122512905 [Leptopilina heterotoma]|uniref:uncharacterized protein LOC122512905 n=1 Tax=Leptopilina heterotoma TaxID=63436 RepID=UPI001CA92BDF|nr:uncharacterized protein LOC122512905 [Leptopilina heterotoma]